MISNIIIICQYNLAVTCDVVVTKRVKLPLCILDVFIGTEIKGIEIEFNVKQIFKNARQNITACKKLTNNERKID